MGLNWNLPVIWQRSKDHCTKNPILAKVVKEQKHNYYYNRRKCYFICDTYIEEILSFCGNTGWKHLYKVYQADMIGYENLPVC